MGSSIGLGIGLPIGQTKASDHRNSLLPADQTGAVGPKIDQDIPESEDTTVLPVSRLARAHKFGLAEVSTRARLGGRLDPGLGELSMGGTAWLESTWKAPESGRYQVVLESERGAETGRETGGENTHVTTTAEPNLAVVNAETDTVIKDTSEIESNAINPEATEFAIEHLLSRLTRTIVLPHVGLIGRIPVNFILTEVYDHMIEVRPQGGGTKGSQEMTMKFNAYRGEIYRVRFTTHNGFSGQSDNDDG